MVFRIFVEKKAELANEANALCAEIRSFLGIQALESVRILNRYDTEGVSRALFDQAVKLVFSEPPVDLATDSPLFTGELVFAVEYLPGQFDQRADSAAQCIRLLAPETAPVVRTAKLYALRGGITPEELSRIKQYVINPVECRETDPLAMPQTLARPAACPPPIARIDGFCAMDEEALEALRIQMGLAMDHDDIVFCQNYFQSEDRSPSVTELRMIDTYWSDHCRHTTFLTTIDGVEFEDKLIADAYAQYLESRRKLGRDRKPICLMDVATLAARVLKAEGKLSALDESEEINACTVKITVKTEHGAEPYLLLFKNETHNHPTEIEPFGGAATCIGGAIRDPLSGRAYVYAAMRLTGAADPTRPLSETLPGKLPQKKLVTTAAAGYSSYGNQIGLATGMVDEFYHDGFAAKHMELGAVLGAVPQGNVRREVPEPGDVVILLGGRTGRDGCGGATGSSKSHTLDSLATCGAEVQKGNAPEERKLQRLFRSPEAMRLVKRCNDFGAGGVSVAVGELADGLSIDLDRVPVKYDGLDGTELAISESQERMAVVTAAEDAEAFCAFADAENLESTVVAEVTEEKRLRMSWRGDRIVDLSRAFLDSNGAEKHTNVTTAPSTPFVRPLPCGQTFAQQMTALVSSLPVCSRRSLSERFDSTIGAGTVLMPFGGKRQLTPIQTMVHKIPLVSGHTDTCSFMSYGYDPDEAQHSPFHGAYDAVVNSLCKLTAAGAPMADTYCTFQEYFEKPMHDSRRYGKPLSALLGAFRAQLDYEVASIGGKDSMSGTFEHLDVPPTLVSFAVTTGDAGTVVSPAFKAAGHRVLLLAPRTDADGLPLVGDVQANRHRVRALAEAGAVYAAWVPVAGGVAEGIFKMALGNGIGFAFDAAFPDEALYRTPAGSFLLEVASDIKDGVTVGVTTAEPTVRRGAETVSLDALEHAYEGTLASVYPLGDCGADNAAIAPISSSRPCSAAPTVRRAKPTVVIPVFPGTNCEYDTAHAFADAGAEPRVLVLNNKTETGIASSVANMAQALQQADILFLPGGFSGGDEPDGSGKFITAFLRSAPVRDAVTDLLDRRGGLVGGICNGFQALIKLGLVPFGKITDQAENAPTLTFNCIGVHQSRLVRVRVSSVLSPWMTGTKVGEIYTVPISHGEGRVVADADALASLAANGQIATQYVDLAGQPSSVQPFNPNGSMLAIEGMTSPDGRVFGKMGHTERIGKYLYRNVPGSYDMHLFDSAVRFFKG